MDYPADILEAFKEGISDPYFLDRIPFEYRTSTTTTVQETTLQISTTTATTASTKSTPEPIAHERYDLYLIPIVGITPVVVVVMIFLRSRARHASKPREPS